MVNYFLKNVLHATNKNIMWLAIPILRWSRLLWWIIWKGVGDRPHLPGRIANHPNGIDRSCGCGWANNWAALD